MNIPRVKRDTSEKFELQCDNPEDTFVVRYTNQGEQFREGISIGLESYNDSVNIMLEDQEAIQLRDLLNKLYPADF